MWSTLCAPLTWLLHASARRNGDLRNETEMYGPGRRKMPGTASHGHCLFAPTNRAHVTFVGVRMDEQI